MANEDEADDIIEPEYDFAGGQRGRYADRFPPGTIAVVLDEDVAAEFHDAATVNDALRAFIAISRRLSGAPG
jgi:hypothetical protein